MPKPPTAERGRRRAVAVAPPPPPPRRFFRSRQSRPAAAPPRTNPRPPQDAISPSRYHSYRPLISALLCLAGLAVASYLTIEHYTAPRSLSCVAIAGFNCVKVTTSAQSYVFGIPVAVLGLVFFAGMLPICLPWAWRLPYRILPALRLGAVVVGIGFVFYLLYAELFEIHALCVWCTGVHVLTFLLFVTLVTGWEDAKILQEEAAALQEAATD